ncbi:MAG TPA: SIR2 family protein [Longimicrobiaceae bacterium]|nr:SIR2 family protein [Longimicrobiaceae bacterium]
MTTLSPAGGVGPQPSAAEMYYNHYLNLLDALAEGRVVPFLGAGVGLSDRPEGSSYAFGKQLPSGWELSEYLADRVRLPASERKRELDLARVSQYGAVMLGADRLYGWLREMFDADYPPTTVHGVLAALPGELRTRGAVRPTQLIVTTNYDDGLERAFAAAGEPLDVLWYVAEGKHRGKFYHAAPGAKPRLITRPSTYTEVDPARRSVLLKMHGAVDRTEPQRDSYVITEDHYIEYLARGAAQDIFPVHVAARFVDSHLLFMGYSLRDWNLRVLLYHVWADQERSLVSWAVQKDPDEFDQEYWRTRGIKILPLALADYVGGLREHLRHFSLPGRAS